MVSQTAIGSISRCYSISEPILLKIVLSLRRPAGITEAMHPQGCFYETLGQCNAVRYLGRWMGEFALRP